MSAQDTLQLQAIEIKLAQVLAAINDKDRQEAVEVRTRELPEWINLELAASLKGGAAFATYETKYWLQPCCGLNSRRVGGRKTWARELVLEWLLVTDETLYAYAQKYGAKVPDKYKEMAA